MRVFSYGVRWRVVYGFVSAVGWVASSLFCSGHGALVLLSWRVVAKAVVESLVSCLWRHLLVQVTVFGMAPV